MEYGGGDLNRLTLSKQEYRQSHGAPGMISLDGCWLAVSQFARFSMIDYRILKSRIEKHGPAGIFALVPPDYIYQARV